MKILNENGLRKLITYLEENHPSLEGKMTIKNNHLVLENDFYLSCFVEDDVPIVPPERAESEKEVMVGKSSEPTVKAVGRAGVERQKEQELADTAKKLAKQFPTRVEVEKRAKETGAKVDDLTKAMQDIASKLKVR